MRDRKSDAHVKVVPAGPGMIRYHKNEDKSLNTADNLDVMTRGARTTLHNKTRELGKLRKALTMANRKEKLY